MKVRPPKFSLLANYLGFLVLISAVPLLLVGATSYQVAQVTIQEEAARYTAQLVAAHQNYLDLELSQVEALISNILSVDTITTAISQPDPSDNVYNNLTTQAQIGYVLNSYTTVKGLVSIDLYAINGQHYHVGDTLSAENIRTDVKEQIYNRVIANEGEITWLGIEDNINASSASKKVISIGKLYSRVDSQLLKEKPVALILVNYDVNFFYEHLIQSDLGPDAYLVVADEQNRIIFHPDRSNIGGNLGASFISQASAKSGTFNQSIDGQPVIVHYTRSDLSHWTVFGFIPLANFNLKTQPIQTAMLVSIVISILAILWVALLFSRRVINPIQQITTRFQLFQKGVANWNERLKSASQDEIGELVRWFNTFSDNITALQRSEQALRDSEERYALAVRGANDGLWDWNLRNNKIYLSPRWKAMLGYAEDEIGDDPKEWFSRIHPSERVLLQEHLNDHLNRKTPHFEIEHRILHKDGRYRWFLARGLAVFDANKQAYRMAGSHSEITSRKQVEEQLRHEAYYDPLTGLPNRPFFLNHLRQAIQENRVNPRYQFAVLYMDFDRFKIINDSLGHHIGDKLLIRIAERLSECLRNADLVARLGGDEFSLFLADIESIQAVTSIADRILTRLSQPMELEGKQIVTTASIGILISDPKYTTPDDYLRDADTAMYWAKSNGKARYEVFDSSMRERIVTRLGLETDLRRAIDRKEFILQYQPIINLETGQVRSLEALVRWNHPHLSQISPIEFIPIAEETGLILPIGEWILTEACRQAATWRKLFAGSLPLSMSINVSGTQFVQKDLVQRIEKILNETGLEAPNLHLEITESVIINDPKSAAMMINQLRKIGVKIAMDDFGSGYSSINYLTQFNFDTIKIDQSFISEMQMSQNNLNLVQTIVRMAHGLEMNVVAEGIQTENQLALLKSYGCESGQGYYFSHPLDPEVAEAFLRQNVREHAPATAGMEVSTLRLPGIFKR